MNWDELVFLGKGVITLHHSGYLNGNGLFFPAIRLVSDGNSSGAGLRSILYSTGQWDGDTMSAGQQTPSAAITSAIYVPAKYQARGADPSPSLPLSF